MTKVYPMFFHLCISVIDILNDQRYQPVIELGVGNGRDALFFNHYGVNLVGVDLSTTATEVSNNL